MDQLVTPNDILAPTNETDTPETDVFLWANNLVEIKEDLRIELFLFNKNYVVYRTQTHKNLRRQLEALCIDNLLDFVLDGAEQGMIVRGFEEAEAEKNVLQRTRLSQVDNAKMVLHWLKSQEHEIETFVEDEHDLNRIKGIVVRCSHHTLKKPFYVIKALPRALTMKGKESWMIRNGRFVSFDAEGALRIPADNQLLVLEQDMYVFNPAKLSALFGYDAKKYTIADAKMRLIAQNFRLSITQDETVEQMLKGKKSIMTKLQKVDPTGITQADLMNHADELDLPLMMDDSGAIIITNSKDLSVFVSLLNEDYIESALTGARYEITGKKPLKVTEDTELT